MTPEGFLLLALSDVELSTAGFQQRDTLLLECVTLPDVPPGVRDVFLVLRLGAFEAAIDPERHISAHTAPNGVRTYTFRRTAHDSAEIVLRLLAGGEKKSYAAADVETFDGILEQYANFRHGDGHVEPTADGRAYAISDAGEDLRGRLVLVDRDNGEVLGTVGDADHVHAETAVTEKGHEHDPVYVDVDADGELDARELFVRAIPPEEQTMLTRGASMLSTGISTAANAISNGMTGASNYYIARSTPHPSASPSRDGSAPPTPPPRVIAWANSDRGRKQLQTAHNVTGKAVVISGKTITAVEGLIARAIGGARNAAAADKGKGRAGQARLGAAYGPPRMVQEDPNYPSEKGSLYGGSAPTLSPPPYSPGGGPPALPLRKGSPSPAPSPLSVRSPSPGGAPTPEKGDRFDKLVTKDRIVLSAHLLFNTLGKSGKQIIDAGSESINAVVSHKYGTEAGESARILTGTARNVGLVYVDVTGLGRRALLKTAGKEYVKARIKGRKLKLRTDAQGQVVEAEPATPMPGSPAVGPSYGYKA